MSKDYVAPEFNKSAFNCPHCGAFAHQKFDYTVRTDNYNVLSITNRYMRRVSNGETGTHNAIKVFHRLYSSQCASCQKKSLWIKEYIAQDNADFYEDQMNRSLIYPNIVSAPEANQDMPEAVKQFYNEARQVADNSPRAAAALLRCALEKLTEELGQTKGNLNTRIGNLKNKGVTDDIIKALDVVRVFANEGGSHVGAIDLTGEDNSSIVNKLFTLVNIITLNTITNPNLIKGLHDDMPENKKQGIKDRDNNTP